MTIGPRQSVHRISHPQRGVCSLVIGNGPALLVLDGGVELPLAKARWAGSSSAEGTTYAILDPEHGDVRVLRVECGTSHTAVWHPQHGPGWWVQPPGPGRDDRLEFDSGITLPMPWSKLSVGPPGWLETKEGKKYASTAEETHWRTFAWGMGMMVLRQGGPPPEGITFDANGLVGRPEEPKRAKPRARMAAGKPMSRAAALRVAKGWHVEPLSGCWLRYYPGGEKAEARPDDEGRYAGIFTRADGTPEGILRDTLPLMMARCDELAQAKPQAADGAVTT